MKAFSRIDPPTWALGLLVALVTFPVYFAGPGGGLDASWGAGLYMAVHDGLEFGPDIVYTYGPLGFLFAPVLWFDGLAVISFLYSTALWVGLAIAVVWTLRRSLGAPAAVLIGFAVLALFSEAEVALAAAVLWAFSVLRPERPRWALGGLIVGGALFAAVEILIKLSVGPIILAVMLLGLIGARARLIQIGLFAGIFGVAVLVLWLATGGEPGNLVDYVANGREIISGYSEALNTPYDVEWQMAALAAIVPLLIAAAALATHPDGRARICAIGIVAFAGFAIYKEGVVRADEGHMAIATTTMVLLWLAIPAAGRGRFVLVGGLIVLSALAIKVQPGTDTGRLNPIETLGEAEEQAELLLSGSRRAELREFGRSVLIGAFVLDEATLAELEGRSVSVDPWEISVAWAYELDWSPVPVFQNYQAYTEKLDRLNADVIADPAGPERILRENPSVVTRTPEATRGVDNHYPSWDPPAQGMATLCNFEPLTETQSWQVLGRVPDRCGEPELIASVDSAFGEPVDVPAAGPGEVVFARIDGAQVSGLEKLRTLLFRARFRYALLDGASYRLVPGTAADGLLLDGSPRLIGTAPWADAPRAETIELVGVDGDLRYDFYAMSVTSKGESNPGRGGN